MILVRIVVIDGYTVNPSDNPWTPLEKLGELVVNYRTAAESVESIGRDADVLITNKCPISAAAIDRLPKLKFIAVTATGYNIVDVAAARRRGVPVSNVPEYGTRTVAQFTWALILELCHHVGRHAESVRDGDWTKSPDFCYWLTPQVELAGKCLGVVGYGRIARQVAEIGKAFGMRVSASGRPGSVPPKSANVEWLSTEGLFATADVVSLHCPLSSETERMVNRQLLERMKRGAFLVNTSRGGLVNEQDLADALRAGTIAGAAMDVVSMEPIDTNNPLLSAPNCWITPHIAWTSLAARQRLMQSTAENVAAFLAGKPINVVN
ncbi:MAG TPA: D-2-hydroxyacid dehydrogenase [Lacipirellulaceae bacterium]|jgi:glycerate dehydrogenase|nr:D-2-hydroxyacid dehydrogenase [Lacipirellulaceae bacterium]